MIKRYNCTVSDRRGEFGLCMEKSDSGKFVLFSEYEKLLKKYENLKERKLRKLKVREATRTPEDMRKIKVI